MAYIIGVVSQKGGVGKSTIARLIATEFARMDGATWDVKIADLDVSQATSFHWMQRRHSAQATPEIRVEGYQRVEKAIAEADHFDVMVLDGAPHATADTHRVAKAAQLVVIPTGSALDDLEPSVRLAHELRKAGVQTSNVIFALTRTGDSEAETAEAREYIAKAGYSVAGGSLPERVAYRRASDLGFSVSETGFPTLNERARALFASLIAPLQSQQSNERAA
jgi:chromosome partitioning protein